MTGGAAILLRRDGELVATDGEPFGRFADLPAGSYAASVAAGHFIRGPVAATVPASGIGRATVVLDAGWLVGQVVAEPSGQDVTGQATLSWEALSDMPEDAARHGRSPGDSAAVLLPTGTYRVTARIGAAEGTAEVAVTAGEVVLLRVPVRFSTLTLQQAGYGDEGPRVVLTALADDRTAFDARLAGAPVEVSLAPGRYRVTAEHDGQARSSWIVIGPDSATTLTFRP